MLLVTALGACRREQLAGDAAPTPVPAPPPNILLIVVDTLRADHLQPYGYARATTPNMQELLARRGVVVERAYAPSPWTIPSVASLLSGRWPGEVLPHTFVEELALAPRIPTIASVLRAHGYTTAAVMGNPTIHPGLGFERGFDGFFAPPSLEEGILRQHAEQVSARAADWLRAHRGQRTFLYVHFMDPHDPYDNAEIVVGRSPFDDPRYAGTITGNDIHGLFLGKVPLRDPAADVPHVVALYDAEVHHVDSFLAPLLAAIEPGELRHTLVVLTADHGEELHDHGGWKHGRTLYEEQLRVPLLLRWDGQLAAGTRLRGPARLIDIAPTIAEAAGAPAPPGWQGRSLLPALRGGSAPSPPALFAEHLADGPPRAAVIGQRWKLVLFDREAPFTPHNELESILYGEERARLARVELYDLAHDPLERRNEADAHPDVVARLALSIHAQLGRETPGVRVLLAGLRAGARAEVTLRWSSPAGGPWRPLLLRADDRVSEPAPGTLRLDLGGDPVPKGVVLPADATITSVTTAGAPVQLRLGSGAAHAGGATGGRALRGDAAVAPSPGPTLWLWLPYIPTPPPARSDPETLRRLRALGYAGG